MSDAGHDAVFRLQPLLSVPVSPDTASCTSVAEPAPLYGTPDLIATALALYPTPSADPDLGGRADHNLRAAAAAAAAAAPCSPRSPACSWCDGRLYSRGRLMVGRAAVIWAPGRH